MTRKEKMLFFPEILMEWDDRINTRSMPWKGERNPYRIWLSEVILQQTRVDQGREYYKRFIEIFPDVCSLANAEDEKVFKLWEGLGYYSRCRNLLKAARFIAFELDGKFPDRHDQILALPGIGIYTAAAISSFAFDLPYAVNDGNVQRVLARFFGLTEPVDTTAGKKMISTLAQTLLAKYPPAKYNQAIMDFGALVCKPAPLCEICPLNSECIAFRRGIAKMLPVKSKKQARKARYFYYLVAEIKEEVLIRQRNAKDIWQSLWEFPLVELPQPLHSPADILKEEQFEQLISRGFELIRISETFRQHLTHQTIEAVFLHVKLKKPQSQNGRLEVNKSLLSNFAFPRIINAYLEKERPGTFSE